MPLSYLGRAIDTAEAFVYSSSRDLMIRYVHLLYAVALFCGSPIYSQSFLNIHYQDGSDKNVPFSSLQKITFDETSGNVNILLTDATTQALTFAALQRLTTADAGAGSLLPVELVSFTGTANHSTVVLSWRTATEVNNYGFDIERCSQNIVWQKIAFIPGHGSSSSPKEYSHVDSPQDGTSFRYRLKQIDGDGKYTYSAVVNITIGTPATYGLKQNYPNPFNPSTTIAYQIPVDGFVTLKVYDILGKEVATIVNENKKAGSYDVTFDGSRLSSRMYICRMKAASYSSATKMLLTK